MRLKRDQEKHVLMETGMKTGFPGKSCGGKEIEGKIVSI
jgi:hypothetical protein